MMNQQEKIYKTMANAGAAGIAAGIVVIIASVCAGVVMIVHGAKLLSSKSDLLI